MIEGGERSAFLPQRITLITAALAIGLLFLLTVWNSPPPTIDLEFGDTSILIASDRAWTFLPGDCVNLRWELTGITSLHVDGLGKIGADETRFCPDINATSPLFEVRAQNGIYRSFNLNIHHLPDLLFYLVGFVCFVGSPMLAIYYCWRRRLEQPLPVVWLLLGGMVLIALGAWLRLSAPPPPLIDEAQGNFAVRIWSDQDRILFPHECINVRWSVVGAAAVRFNVREMAAETNPASALHCAEDGSIAQLDFVDADGESKSYHLPIASQFPQSAPPPPFFYLSLLGIILGLVVYVPIFAQHWRKLRLRQARADLICILGCFFVVLVLYLPFGFDSSGHWEEWIIHGYTEGGTLSFYVSEAVSRPFVMVPHTLAYLISSESFIGHHLVNFLLYSGEMALLYIILRQLGVAPFYAFLTTILFMFYPVNDALMTLRRLPNNFSEMTLLLAVALFLDYIKSPRRLTLLGMWLALLYSVNSNETGFALIAIAPALLWLRDRRIRWRNVNLSAIWYIVPAFKLAYVVLLLATGRDFYQRGLLSAGGETGTTATVFDIFFSVLATVYTETFIYGWADALAALGMNLWWLPTAFVLAGVAFITWFHIRGATDGPAPTLRQAAASLGSGLLLIIAAIAVLMWVQFYREDSWRMYVYVPIGASISLFSLILLLTAPIRDRRRRDMAVAAACLLLLIPAASRLFAQQHGFVESAYTKARILYRTIEIAPAIAPGAQLAMLTELNHIELGERGIGELIATDMLNSALHVLYQERAPEVAYVCHTMRFCGEFDGKETIFSPSASDDLLGRTLVFLLNDDYTVELLEDPAALLGLDWAADYEASALYDADAPLPPRATTMLGTALQR